MNWQPEDLVYVACPYSHPDRDVRAWRFDMANRAAALLIAKGRAVYSPISMTHPIDIVLATAKIETESSFWVSLDERFMKFCSEIVVLTLDGWLESTGVSREIAFFKALGRPITFVGEAEIESAHLPSVYMKVWGPKLAIRPSLEDPKWLPEVELARSA